VLLFMRTSSATEQSGDGAEIERVILRPVVVAA
jgi:hypothetical protein